MLKESSNKENKKFYSEITKIEEEKMICKDGFCSLPNQKEISIKNKNKINLFDPI